MMSAELLGTLERVVFAAIRLRGTYKKRMDETLRVFGGVNLIMCADLWQLHPINGTFIASNPLDVPAGCAHRALELFWTGGRRQHTIFLGSHRIDEVRGSMVQLRPRAVQRG